MRKRIFFKLLGAFLLVIAVATVTLDLGIRRAWEQSLYSEIQTGLTQKTLLFAHIVEQERDRRAYEQIAEEVSRFADARATIIEPNGRVLADTRANPAEMENHATRPEFVAALRGRVGSNVRTSHTVGIPFLYVAAPISGGAVRLAYPLASIQEMTRHVRLHLLYASAVALLLATFLSAIVAQAISRRLRRIVRFAEQVAGGDLSARIAESSQDEIAQVAAALDRTAHKLQHNFQAIERAESTRRDFVANVSHELKTPLTSIVGYTETLLETEADPVRREFVETVRRNAERMTRLTEDLLTLARIESGNLQLSPAAVPAAQLLQDAETSFRDIAAGRGVELRVTELATRAVRADADAVHQVFGNLIDNALKYGAASPIELGAREARDGVEFYVRDHGPGIAAEHLPRLFERFYRVDKARSREAGGTGLGLAIVKHLVAVQGGQVRVESAEGSGSTFLFRLPLATIADPAVQPAVFTRN